MMEPIDMHKHLIFVELISVASCLMVDAVPFIMHLERPLEIWVELKQSAVPWNNIPLLLWWYPCQSIH